VRIDSTFAGDYELGVPDGGDRSKELAYGYPPGHVIDAATLERPETATIVWSVGGTAVESEPMAWPDPVRLDVRPADAARWLGIFQGRAP
jgi:hypothetical protein